MKKIMFVKIDTESGQVETTSDEIIGRFIGSLPKDGMSTLSGVEAVIGDLQSNEEGAREAELTPVEKKPDSKGSVKIANIKPPGKVKDSRFFRDASDNLYEVIESSRFNSAKDAETVRSKLSTEADWYIGGGKTDEADRHSNLQNMKPLTIDDVKKVVEDGYKKAYTEYMKTIPAESFTGAEALYPPPAMPKEQSSTALLFSEMSNSIYHLEDTMHELFLKIEPGLSPVVTSREASDNGTDRKPVSVIENELMNTIDRIAYLRIQISDVIKRVSL